MNVVDESSTTHQKVCLLAALASLNNGHNFNLHNYYVGMKSSSKPSLVPTKPLRSRSTTWQSSLVTNLSSIMLRCTPTAEAKAHTTTSCYHVAVTTLAHSFIWPCNNFVLSNCTSSFLVSPSLALKFVKCKLNLCSSYLGMSAKVSTT